MHFMVSTERFVVNTSEKMARAAGDKAQNQDPGPDETGRCASKLLQKRFGMTVSCLRPTTEACLKGSFGGAPQATSMIYKIAKTLSKSFNH